jgi:hypothetical protein
VLHVGAVMSDSEKKQKLTTYGLWVLGSLLNRLTVLRKSEDDRRSEGQSIAVSAETLRSEGGWDKTISDMLKRSFADSEKGLLGFFDEVKEMRELASKCIDESGRQRYAEDLSLLNELVSEPGCPFIVEIPDGDRQTILLHGYIETFIKQKWETLCKIHELNTRTTNFLLEDTAPTKSWLLDASQRRAVESLRGLFTDGANKYPGLAHKVMSWPITRYMPCPPKDEFPDFTLPKASRDLPYNWPTSLPTLMLVTRETLSTNWLVPHAKAEWDTSMGCQRLGLLARQAGEVVAKLCPDLTIWIHLGRVVSSGNLWLQTVHLLQQTCRHDDGWDGLFDDDSDFWDEAWRKGLYKFWKSDDIFLDSALACNALLAWGDARAQDTRDGPRCASLPIPQGPTDVNTQSMKWDVFISHASEDKEAFVRPLAAALQEKGIRVWLDELVLTVGDSLRRSIDDGLARSRYGVVVISPDFLKKEWPQKELDGLTAREVDGRKVILPVWHHVDRQTVLQYSPLLADRVASVTTHGLDGVVQDLMKAMRC